MGGRGGLVNIFRGDAVTNLVEFWSTGRKGQSFLLEQFLSNGEDNGIGGDGADAGSIFHHQFGISDFQGFGGNAKLDIRNQRPCAYGGNELYPHSFLHLRLTYVMRKR